MGCLFNSAPSHFLCGIWALWRIKAACENGSIGENGPVGSRSKAAANRNPALQTPSTSNCNLTAQLHLPHLRAFIAYICANLITAFFFACSRANGYSKSVIVVAGNDPDTSPVLCPAVICLSGQKRSSCMSTGRWLTTHRSSRVSVGRLSCVVSSHSFTSKLKFKPSHSGLNSAMKCSHSHMSDCPKPWRALNAERFSETGSGYYTREVKSSNIFEKDSTFDESHENLQNELNIFDCKSHFA